MTSHRVLQPLAARLLLTLALLAGQTFLAYHAPSHIPDGGASPITEALLFDDCQLGAQAHAPGLPPAVALPLPATCQNPLRHTAVAAHRPAPNSLPQARAPPLSV